MEFPTQWGPEAFDEVRVLAALAHHNPTGITPERVQRFIKQELAQDMSVPRIEQTLLRLRRRTNGGVVASESARVWYINRDGLKYMAKLVLKFEPATFSEKLERIEHDAQTIYPVLAHAKDPLTCYDICALTGLNARHAQNALDLMCADGRAEEVQRGGSPAWQPLEPATALMEQ